LTIGRTGASVAASDGCKGLTTVHNRSARERRRKWKRPRIRGWIMRRRRTPHERAEAATTGLITTAFALRMVALATAEAVMTPRQAERIPPVAPDESLLRTCQLAGQLVSPGRRLVELAAAAAVVVVVVVVAVAVAAVAAAVEAAVAAAVVAAVAPAVVAPAVVPAWTVV
jgi:hypothetical protein